MEVFLCELQHNAREGCEHDRIQGLESLPESVHRLQKRQIMQLPAKPRVQLPEALGRHGARVVFFGRSNEHQIALQVHAAWMRNSPANERAANCLERVVHAHRQRVLHEDSGFAAGSGALPHQVPVEIQSCQALGAPDEHAQLVEANSRVGDPLVEVLHQLAAMRNGKVAQARGFRRLHAAASRRRASASHTSGAAERGAVPGHAAGLRGPGARQR